MSPPTLTNRHFGNSHLLISFLSLSLLFSAMSASGAAAACGTAPTRPATQLVEFLQDVQSEALATFGSKGFDPKLYVDLPLKTNLSAAIAAFAKLQRSDGVIVVPELNNYISNYFGDAGSDLIIDVPTDFEVVPHGFLPKVEHPKVRAWALEGHEPDDVRERQERHTLLSLPGPMVVPGSMFREVYYWDSYWTIRGFLASKMYDTAKAIVYNLVSLIDVYGFVLNGARTYYSNRSQPPLLSAMVFEIYTRTGDLAFVKKTLPSLLKEHTFWSSGIHEVTIQDHQGHNHSLSRYNAMWNKPRPESATIDEESASKLSNAIEKENFYHQLASAAESGWDFSSRWMRF